MVNNMLLSNMITEGINEEIKKKRLQTLNAGEGAKKKESSYTVGENAN